VAELPADIRGLLSVAVVVGGGGGGSGSGCGGSCGESLSTQQPWQSHPISLR